MLRGSRDDSDRLEAEKAVQKLLLDLEEKTGKRIDYLRVDTRNFENCAVEIFLKADRFPEKKD